MGFHIYKLYLQAQIHDYINHLITINIYDMATKKTKPAVKKETKSKKNNCQPNPLGAKTKSYIAMEDRYGAHNYHPLPVVLKKGKGICCVSPRVHSTTRPSVSMRSSCTPTLAMTRCSP